MPPVRKRFAQEEVTKPELPRFRVWSERIREIEDRLLEASAKKERVPKYHLEGELQEMQASIRKIKNTAQAIFANSYLSQIEENITSLYRKLALHSLHDTLHKIQSATEEMRASIITGSVTTQKVNWLKRKIFALLQQYRPDRSGLRIISDAKRTVQDATHYLETLQKRLSPPLLRIQHDLTVSESATIDTLFDSASLLYAGKENEARELFETIPIEEQEHVRVHLHYLSAKAFTDILPTVQSMLAVANEISRNGITYFTAKDVKKLMTDSMKMAY